MTQDEQKYALWAIIFGFGWMMAVNVFLLLLVFGMLQMG